MGVEPKIGGKPPKWMVYFMVPNPIKMDDLGAPPLFLEIPQIIHFNRVFHFKPILGYPYFWK